MHRVGDEGRLLADNVYGTLDEDAMRRDLSANALYYDPLNGDVLDYHHGLEDIRQGVLRIIGDPSTRLREDPVRMIRTIRFAAKLGFEIDPLAVKEITRHVELLTNVPPARLFEEVLKLFHSGSAIDTFEKLRQFGLFRYLFPQTDKILESEEEGYPRTFLPLALKNTDKRIQQGKPVIPAFLYAVLLWEPFRAYRDQAMQEGASAYDSIHPAADQVILEQLASVAIPRRFTAQVREIWTMQFFFDQRKSRQVYRLLENRKFRAGYDFLCIRAQAGEQVSDGDLTRDCQWWTDLQKQSAEQQKNALFSTARKSGSGKPKRKRRSPAKKKKSNQAE